MAASEGEVIRTDEVEGRIERVDLARRRFSTCRGAGWPLMPIWGE